MMEQNTTNKPLRRVGTLTLGVCLIAAGVDVYKRQPP